MPTISEQLTQLESDRQDLVDNLETKGITGLSGDETFTELVPEVLNIPSGGGTVVEEKDVTFYDYDGTVVASYTTQEFLALTEMPANPTHEGLIAQGWNWTLADAKEYVQDYKILDIGQMCKTSDNKTRIYIELKEGGTKPYLKFAVNGTVNVDWGDGTNEDITGIRTNITIATSHEYSSAGNYIIKLTSNVIIYFLEEMVSGSTNSDYDNSLYYKNITKKVELSSNVSLNGKVFKSHGNLSSVNMPSEITTIGQNCFEKTNKLKYITIPINVTTIARQCFLNASGLYNISLPKGISAFQDYAFDTSGLRRITIPNSLITIGNSSLTKNYYLMQMIIPNSVRTINQGCFSSMSIITKIIMSNEITYIPYSCFANGYSLAYLDFSNNSQIPTLQSTNVFSGVPSDCKIIVPDDLYEDWIGTSNWSSLTQQFVKASQYNA